MKNAEIITVISEKREIPLNVRTILYVQMKGNTALIHTSCMGVIETRVTLYELEKRLGNFFVKVKRGCIVSVFAIHNITDSINLCNGESLGFAQRNKEAILEEFISKQREIINGFMEECTPKDSDGYHEYYKVFDNMPFAFTDIEMIFDEKFSATDWVFCYGNKAFADLEKMPLDQMIGSSFGTLFPNMDAKWLRTYERAALFEETLNIVDYSREIDANLEIICFPTFKGHCGCILFDVEKMKFFRNTDETDKAISAYIMKMLG